MAWHRRWLGVSLVGLSVWLLSGCASELPDWARSQHSYAEDISLKAPPVVRLQTPDGSAVTLKPPLLPPPEPASKPPIPAQPDSGIQQTSYANRGKVRVRVRAWVNGRPIFDDEVMQGAGPEMRRVYSLPESQRSEKMTELLNTV